MLKTLLGGCAATGCVSVVLIHVDPFPHVRILSLIVNAHVLQTLTYMAGEFVYLLHVYAHVRCVDISLQT